MTEEEFVIAEDEVVEEVVISPFAKEISINPLNGMRLVATDAYNGMVVGWKFVTEEDYLDNLEKYLMRTN